MELPATLADRPYLQGSLATMPAPTKPPADDDAWHKVAYGFDATCGMQDREQWTLDFMLLLFDDLLDFETHKDASGTHEEHLRHFTNSLFCGFRVGSRDFITDPEVWKAVVNTRYKAFRTRGVSRIDPATVEKRESPAPPVLPQDLQSAGETFICGRNVASVIAATAGKLAATPENIQAAAKASLADPAVPGTAGTSLPPHPPLLEELAAIPVTKTNEEVMEDKVLAESKQAEAQLDELLEDVRDGLADFEQRKNKHNVVLLIDVDGRRCWLRKGSHDIYLERDGLAQGVIVCTQAPTGTWVPTVRRDDIREWLKLKPGPSAKDVPAAASRASLVGAPATGVALDEIGEFARNAPREDAP